MKFTSFGMEWDKGCNGYPTEPKVVEIDNDELFQEIREAYAPEDVFTNQQLADWACEKLRKEMNGKRTEAPPQKKDEGEVDNLSESEMLDDGWCRCLVIHPPLGLRVIFSNGTCDEHGLQFEKGIVYLGVSFPFKYWRRP